MIQSPQAVRISRDGSATEATVAWCYEAGAWVVGIDSPVLGVVEARESDAFEALCAIRAQLEPRGWRIGVAGAQADVWPSGMARDQGGGLVVYRLEPGDGMPVIDTFAPVDPALVCTLDEQRAAARRAWDVNEDHEDLSDAIVTYLRNYPGRNDEEFQAGFAAEARDSVQAVLDETARIRVQWGEKSLLEIGDEVERILRERHPELSSAALEKLSAYFIYLVR